MPTHCLLTLVQNGFGLLMIRTRDDAIDGLRAFAVIAVVLCHLSKLCVHCRLLNSDFWQGACGAHLLLVISGFSMAAVLSRTQEIQSFLLDRVLKIYPIYAMGIVLSALMIVVFQPPEYTITLPQFLASMTMCQSWMGQPEIDGAYWLVGVLLKFYLLIGAAILVGMHGKRVELFAVAYLVGAALWRVNAEYGVELPGILGRLANIQHAHLMVAGMIIWANREYGYNVTRCGAFVCCIGLEAAGTEMPAGSAVIIGLMLVCFAREYIPVIASPAATMLGNSANATYMIHGVLAYTVMKYVGHAVPVEVAIAISLGCALVAGELLTLAVTPGRRTAPAAVPELMPARNQFELDPETVVATQVMELMDEVDQFKSNSEDNSRTDKKTALSQMVGTPDG